MNGSVYLVEKGRRYFKFAMPRGSFGGDGGFPPSSLANWNAETEKYTGYILFMHIELGYGLISREFRFLFVDFPDIAFPLIMKR